MVPKGNWFLKENEISYCFIKLKSYLFDNQVIETRKILYFFTTAIAKIFHSP